MLLFKSVLFVLLQKQSEKQNSNWPKEKPNRTGKYARCCWNRAKQARCESDSQRDMGARLKISVLFLISLGLEI